MIEILSYFKTNKLYEITFFSKKFNDCLNLEIITYKLLQIHCNLEKLMNSFFEVIDFIIDSLKKNGEYKKKKKLNKKHWTALTIQKDKILSEDFVKIEFIIQTLTKIKNNKEFSEMIKKAIDIGKRQKTKEALLKQAEDNSWEIRAKDIVKRLH